LVTWLNETLENCKLKYEQTTKSYTVRPHRGRIRSLLNVTILVFRFRSTTCLVLKIYVEESINRISGYWRIIIYLHYEKVP